LLLSNERAELIHGSGKTHGQGSMKNFITLSRIPRSRADILRETPLKPRGSLAPVR